MEFVEERETFKISVPSILNNLHVRECVRVQIGTSDVSKL